MRIVHLAAEVAPFAKVGGLADVLYGLPRAQAAAGHDVTVVMPKYRTLQKGSLDGVQIVFVDLPTYFDRENVYGYPDDPERFAHFCKEALSLIGTPDIIHLHDWHTALTAALTPLPTILTIHNLAYQGVCTPQTLKAFGLPPDAANCLRTGIIHADAVTTVSPTYAKEVLATSDLAPLLRGKFTGILNGIASSYSTPTISKQAAKRKLQRQFGFKETDVPLVAAIARLVHQKAPELIHEGLRYTLAKGGQAVLLGAAPDPATEKTFHDLRSAHLEFTFNEALSHLVYTAADLLLVPSHFEPCGLTQMIAMRHGTVPLVRQTGGLADTVFEGENGFTFGPPEKSALRQALDRAFTAYADKATWNQLIANGQSQDFSWTKSAQKYVELYRLSCAKI